VLIVVWPSLLNVDASRLVLLGLGDNNAQDTIVEFSRDVVLVYTSGEVEAARKLAEAALGEPVLGLVSKLLLNLLGLFLVGNLSAGLVSLGLLLILDSGVMGAAVFLVVVGDSASGFSALDEASGRSAGSVGAFGLAANEHSLRLGELDVNVRLLHAGEFAVKLVGLSSLADIELGLPVAKAAAASAISVGSLARVAVEVVKKTEERGEGGVGVVEVAGEESHCVCCGDGFKSEVLQVDSV
jgi:hypothetical protein